MNMQRFIDDGIPPLAGQLPRDWRHLRAYVFQRDNFACVMCGRRGRLECDHVRPRAAGGSDHPDNLQTLCVPCHIAKTKADKGHPDPESVQEWDRYVNASRYVKRRRG